MEIRDPWGHVAVWAMLLLALSALSCAGCYRCSTTQEECGISGPCLDGNGKVLDPNLYLTYTYSKPGKVILRDNAGHELFSRLLHAPSNFKIGIEGRNLVINAKSGENLLRVPVSATPETTLRHETKAQDMSAKWFSVLLHVQTGSHDTIFELTVEYDR